MRATDEGGRNFEEVKDVLVSVDYHVFYLVCEDLRTVALGAFGLTLIRVNLFHNELDKDINFASLKVKRKKFVILSDQ